MSFRSVSVSALALVSALVLPRAALAAPKLVVDHAPGAAGTELAMIGALGNSAVIVDTTSPTAELRITDGTQAGTTVLPFDGDLHVRDAAVSSGTTLYFLASGDAQTKGIWQTDGTSAGTRRLMGAEVESSLTLVGTRVVAFDYNGGGVGGTLRSVDPATGTTADLGMLGAGFVGFARVASSPSALYLERGFGNSPPRLRRTDGTSAGTSIVKELPAGDVPSQLTSTTTHVFFRTQQDASSKIWASDGTAAGTLAVATFAEPVDSATNDDLDHLQVSGGLAFFRRRVTGGFELWRSDGTQPGTFSLGLYDTLYGELSMFGRAKGKTFFTGRSEATGDELWETDGTAAGTHLFMDLRAGKASSTPQSGSQRGATFVFAAWTGLDSNQWLKSDGTTAGTLPLFTGTPPGTRPFAGEGALDSIVAGDNFFFMYDDTTHGAELWVDSVPGSSGTGAGSPGSSGGTGTGSPSASGSGDGADAPEADPAAAGSPSSADSQASSGGCSLISARSTSSGPALPTSLGVALFLALAALARRSGARSVDGQHRNG